MTVCTILSWEFWLPDCKLYNHKLDLGGYVSHVGYSITAKHCSDNVFTI